MIPSRRPWSLAFVAFAVAVLAGCAGISVPGSGPAADAPTYHVGDRWVYHAEDGFRSKTVWEETHEIVAIGADGIAVRITQKGPSTDTTRTELWPAPGQVKVGSLYDSETRRFATPLGRYDFPLAGGKSWNQRIDNLNEATGKTGSISHYVRVLGWAKVTTPAGTFDAVEMQVIMRLDDEEFWRTATECNYSVWYAPAVRGAVKEKKDARYMDKGGGARDGTSYTRTLYEVMELVSFTPGRT